MRPSIARTAAATALLTLLGLSGCVVFILPTELPAIVDYVLANVTTFQVSDDGPLADVAAGTVVDPLGDLTGCWAAYWHVEPPQSAVEFEAVETLEFDAAAGTLIRTVLERVGSAGHITVQHGTYAVAGDDRFTFTVQTVEANLAGQIVDVTDKYDTLPEYTVYATRSGDYLKTQFEMPAGDPRTPAGFADRLELRHRQFDCPSQ